MRLGRIELAYATAAVVLALAPDAAIGAVLPPGNSAANQYTESFPTSGGNAPTADKGHSTPAQALGAKDARRLEAKGSEGRAVAMLAAATAPPARAGGGDGSDAMPGSTPSGNATRSAEGAAAGGGGGEGQPEADTAKRSDGASAGSSGIGEVLGQATGSSSSGKLGPLLPLVIAAALVWSIAYALRRRQRVG